MTDELIARLDEAATKCGDDPALWAHLLRALPAPVRRRVNEDFGWQAHDGQIVPPQSGDWRIWLLMAGRGFGKTRAGAEWVQAQAARHGDMRIALLGATREDVERVMIAGPSGLLATAKTGMQPQWRRSAGRIDWPNGAQGFAFSAEAPEALRGPEHDAAWCDELAKWTTGARAWDNLMLGLRRGANPQVVVTTTPKAGSPLLDAVMAAPGIVTSNGRTADNAHLPAAFRAAVEAQWTGTRWGRQELDGEYLRDVEGALWTPRLLDQTRWAAVRAERAREKFDRIVVGVDPPASEAGTCGIIVAGRIGDSARVLDDCSAVRASPATWAAAVARTCARWQADRVIAEANMGGAMVREVLTVRHRALPVRLVHASAGKAARAEPVAALFENHRAGIAGRFAALEAELVRIKVGERPEPSPDRADAMVWALSALMLRGGRGPRVHGF